MTQERISLGKMGEDLAVVQLRALKYKIIERNFKCALGEIDIIAREKDTLVFVEVKTRRTRDFEGPAAAVNQRKQRQLSRVALT
jgi:putative endonuclease